MSDARTTAMAEADGGRFVANVVHFARILRGAGLPIGPGREIEAVRARKPSVWRRARISTGRSTRSS